MASPKDSGEGTRRNVNPKLAASGVLTAVLLVFALLNTHEVGVDFIVDTVTAPLIVVVVVAAALGAAIGALAAYRGRD